MKKRPYTEGLVENCLEDEAWECILETAEVPESFEEFVSAVVDLVCSKQLSNHVVLVQINGA